MQSRSSSFHAPREVPCGTANLPGFRFKNKTPEGQNRRINRRAADSRPATVNLYENPAMDKLIDTSGLETALREFAEQRDWERFHTPRNLILALTGEVGEL